MNSVGTPECPHKMGGESVRVTMRRHEPQSSWNIGKRCVPMFKIGKNHIAAMR